MPLAASQPGRSRAIQPSRIAPKRSTSCARGYGASQHRPRKHRLAGRPKMQGDRHTSLRCRPHLCMHAGSSWCQLASMFWGSMSSSRHRTWTRFSYLQNHAWQLKVSCTCRLFPAAPQVYAPGLHDRPHSSHLVKYFFSAYLHCGLCKEVRPELCRSLQRHHIQLPVDLEAQAVLVSSLMAPARLIGCFPQRSRTLRRQNQVPIGFQQQPWWCLPSTRLRCGVACAQSCRMQCYSQKVLRMVLRRSRAGRALYLWSPPCQAF